MMPSPRRSGRTTTSGTFVMPCSSFPSRPCQREGVCVAELGGGGGGICVFVYSDKSLFDWLVCCLVYIHTHSQTQTTRTYIYTQDGFTLNPKRARYLEANPFVCVSHFMALGSCRTGSAFSAFFRSSSALAAAAWVFGCWFFVVIGRWGCWDV